MKRLLLISVLTMVCAQEFVFPEFEEENFEIKLNQSAGVPLYIPGRCPENQLLYPGNENSDWICDCGARFIYYPPKDGCFAAYKQGPCEPNQYLILPESAITPSCVANPCKKDGLVMYNRMCYVLNQPGPCPFTPAGQGVLGVNATTLKIECIAGENSLNLFNFPTNCRPGSRRDNRRCREKY